MASSLPPTDIHLGRMSRSEPFREMFPGIFGSCRVFDIAEIVEIKRI